MTALSPMTPDELYNARNALGLSIRELAKLIQINPHTLARMESQAGRTRPNRYVSDELRRLANENGDL